MIFYKKQHEEIANGFLQRIDVLLRNQSKAVIGYGIDEGVETLKLKIGKAVVELKIEGAMYSHSQPTVTGPEEKKEPAEDAKEVIY